MLNNKFNRILITYDDDYRIAFYLMDEFKRRSIECEFFVTNKTESWINKMFFRKINKMARNLRLISKDSDLFYRSPLSYTRHLESELQKRIISFKPDLIFCIHGQRFGEHVLKNTSLPKIAWWIEPDPNKETLFQFAKPFDLYFSYDSDAVDYLVRNGVNSRYLSHAASPNNFYPIAGTNKYTDILFFGNWSPWREQVLYAAFLITKNISLFGNSWLKKCTLFSRSELRSIYKGKEITGSDLNLAINKSKIILNAQRLKGFSTGLDTRFFDVLSAAGLLLTDAPQDLSTHFEDQKDLLVYDDLDDLKKLICSILNNVQDVDGIKRLGHENVVKNYTYKNFVDHFLEAAKKLEGR